MVIGNHNQSTAANEAGAMWSAGQYGGSEVLFIFAASPPRELLKQNYNRSQSAGSAFDDSFIELLIHNLNRSVDLSVGRSQLMRNQLYEQIDPFNERCASRHGTRG